MGSLDRNCKGALVPNSLIAPEHPDCIELSDGNRGWMIPWTVTVCVAASQACEMLGAVMVSTAPSPASRALCSAFRTVHKTKEKSVLGSTAQAGPSWVGNWMGNRAALGLHWIRLSARLFLPT